MSNLNKQIFSTWYPCLKSFVDNSNYFDNLIKFIEGSYKKSFISPGKRKDIFKPFQIGDYSKVRVVILGDGLYSNSEATGLAFANTDKKLRESDFSPSLLKIKDTVEESVKDGLYLNFDPTLENWSEQGVLMLNTSLTCIYKDPKSHAKYWNRFIKYILQTINDEKTGIIFCLWGDYAQSFREIINQKNHYVLECENPIDSVIKNKKWDCDHFERINEIITQQNGGQYCINW